MMSLSTLFLWNRITSSELAGDSIVLGLSPFAMENEISPHYFISRLRSYGDRELNEFAIKMEQLLALDEEYSPDIVSQFAGVKELTQTVTQPCWFLITGEFSHGRPRLTHIRVTGELVRAVGGAPEELMLRTVKSGTLPAEYAGFDTGPSRPTGPRSPGTAGTAWTCS